MQIRLIRVIRVPIGREELQSCKGSELQSLKRKKIRDDPLNPCHPCSNWQLRVAEFQSLKANKVKIRGYPRIIHKADTIKVKKNPCHPCANSQHK